MKKDKSKRNHVVLPSSNFHSSPIDKNINKIECQVKPRKESNDEFLIDNSSHVVQSKRKRKKKRRGEKNHNDTTFVIKENGEKQRCVNLVEGKNLILDIECELDPSLVSGKRKRKGKEFSDKYATFEEVTDISTSLNTHGEKMNKQKKHKTISDNTKPYVAENVQLQSKTVEKEIPIAANNISCNSGTCDVKINNNISFTHKCSHKRTKQKKTHLINHSNVVVVDDVLQNKIEIDSQNKSFVKGRKVKKKHKWLKDNGEPNLSENSVWRNEMEVANEIDSNSETCLDRVEDDISITCESVQVNTIQEKKDWFSALHYISSSTRDGEQLEMLINKGIIPNIGKWRADEVQQLKNNMKDFLACHEVKDYTRLIVTRTKEDRAFLKETQFVFKMCRGIQRTRMSIGMKIVTEFSDFFHKGKFSDIESDELIMLHRSGKRFKDIGLLLNRNHYNMWNKYNLLSKSWNKGSWNDVEDSALIAYVNIYLKNGKNISWVDVSNIVGTRSSRACLKRWHSKYIQSKQNGESILAENNTYNSILNHKDVYDFTPTDVHKLVSLVYESNIEDEDFIDWIEISTKFNRTTITPSFLKWKFGVVITEVPRYHMLEFGDVIDKIYEIYQKKQLHDNEEGTNCTNEIILRDDYVSPKDVSS